MPALRLAGALGSLHTLQSILEMEQAPEIKCSLHFGDEKCMLVLKTGYTLSGGVPESQTSSYSHGQQIGDALFLQTLQALSNVSWSPPTEITQTLTLCFFSGSVCFILFCFVSRG